MRVQGVKMLHLRIGQDFHRPGTGGQEKLLARVREDDLVRLNSLRERCSRSRGATIQVDRNEGVVLAQYEPVEGI